MIVIELQPVAQDSVFVHKGLLCVVKYTCRGMYMAISADVIKQHFTTMPLWRRAMAIGAPAVVAAGACLLPTVLAESPTLSVCSPPEAVNGHASSTQEQPKTIQGAERSFAMKLGLFINDLNFYGVRAVISDQNAQTPNHPRHQPRRESVLELAYFVWSAMRFVEPLWQPEGATHAKTYPPVLES